MPRFLVIQSAFIGDAILATALIEKLHKHFPGDCIDLMVRKGNEALFHGHPFIDHLYVWDKQRSKYGNLAKLLRSIRSRRYDYLINLQRFFSTGLMALFSNARVRIGFKENPLSFCYHVKVPFLFERGMHEVDRNNALIAHLTDSESMRPALYPTEADVEAVKPLKARPYVCLAPASVWFTKQLPQDKWIELARHLQEKYSLLFLGAPADRAMCDHIIAQLAKPEARNLCGKLSLLQSAALMQDARMNYVNDSAPLHLASSLNAPVTAFFCSTVTDFGFGPLSHRSVVAEIGKPLDCRPCGIHGKKKCPEGHFKCGHDIDVLMYLPDH